MINLSLNLRMIERSLCMQALQVTEFMRFERGFNERLILKNSSDIQIEIIGQFLDSDFYCFGDYYVEWLSSDSDMTGGNLTTILRSRGVVIIINNLTDDEVKMTEEQFSHIVKQWTLIYDTNPKELLIKKIGDQFIFEPTYDQSKLRQLFDHLRNLCRR
jgi:hypothetical protein